MAKKPLPPRPLLMPFDPIDLAQDFIRCPSVTPEEAGAMDLAQKVLEKLGFKVHRKVFESDDEVEPVENLYARIGTAAPNFCFAGHLDVVPVGDGRAWEFDPFVGDICEGYLYGRGAEDMKGAIACFIAAVSRFLEENKKQFNGSISLLLTMDEEGPATNGTKKMLDWMQEQGEKIDICLVGEPTNPNELGEMAKIGRRGSMNCELVVVGKQGHVAYPQLAENPVTQLVNILHALKEKPIDAGTEYFQPSNLEVVNLEVGNTAFNLIPAKASAKFNIRYNDSRPAADIQQWIRSICEKHAPHFDLKMVSTGDAFHSPPNRLTEILKEVSQQVTGRELELSTTGGTSDARFVKNICPVIEFGTTGRTSHQVNENVACDTLDQLTAIYTEVLKRYFA